MTGRASKKRSSPWRRKKTKQGETTMENKKQTNQEAHEEGFKMGILFTLFVIGISVIAWAVVFAPMGWWLR